MKGMDSCYLNPEPRNMPIYNTLFFVYKDPWIKQLPMPVLQPTTFRYAQLVGVNSYLNLNQ